MAVGEEAGGAYDGNNAGTVAQVKLPNTKLTLLVPLISCCLAVNGGDGNSPSVKPNFGVEYSMGDYLTNSD